jgi:hypothetical protein
VHALTGTVGIVALAAGAVALVSLLAVVVLAIRLRRIRADQRLVLGDRREDLVAHSAGLAQQFEALHGYVEDVAASLDARTGTVEDRLETVLTYFSLVRYDAYGEMSGRQSMSIALLDATRSGIVLSAIHHRDQARLYAKEIRAGQGEHELSPEEEEAIRVAVSRGAVGAANAAPARGA